MVEAYPINEVGYRLALTGRTRPEQKGDHYAHQGRESDGIIRAHEHPHGQEAAHGPIGCGRVLDAGDRVDSY